MILQDMIFQRELIEQRRLPFLPQSHHRQSLHLERIELATYPPINQEFFNKIGPTGEFVHTAAFGKSGSFWPLAAFYANVRTEYLTLETILSVPIQKFRPWPVGEAVRHQDLAGRVDHRCHYFDVVALAGNQNSQVVSQSNETPIKHPMLRSRKGEPVADDVGSPILTLQGAIAHSDMPLESGPMKPLPFSQAYLPGYAAWRRRDFRETFEANDVQLPLESDAVFFNPALFHAAGANSSEGIHRFANLLQISSVLGRAMETINRGKMCRLLFPLARQAADNRCLTEAELAASIAATAEGYSFPTHLDRDPPANGLAPETQAAFFKRALHEGLNQQTFEETLTRMEAARLS